MRKKSTLRIDIPHGTWMVDVYKERNDDGIYDLVHPQRQAEVKHRRDHLYGFEYSIAAPEHTPYKLYLDEEVLTEGEVGHKKYARGNGIF